MSAIVAGGTVSRPGIPVFEGSGRRGVRLLLSACDISVIQFAYISEKQRKKGYEKGIGH